MKRFTIAMAILTLIIVTTASSGSAQEVSSVRVVRGDLLAIKGQVYVVKDHFGRLVLLRVDKDTKRERIVLPGEKIEAEMSLDGRAVSIKPTQ